MLTASFALRHKEFSRESTEFAFYQNLAKRVLLENHSRAFDNTIKIYSSVSVLMKCLADYAVCSRSKKTGSKI